MGYRDGIADPWGTRTPFGPGDEWPVRVDQYLVEGVVTDDVERWARTASLLHSNGDAMDVAVRGGRMVGVRGRGEDRVNRGRLGPKDLFGWQANASPDRLTRPLVREGGELVETDWDTAMGAVVAQSQRLLQERGPSAIGFYTTGQLFLEEYYTLAAIGHGAIGTNHMDGNTRLCTATAAAALKETFACDGQPGSYTDIDYADVIALFGHNMAETQSVLWMRILDRLTGPNPPRLVCVDPRETEVARAATASGGVHLAPLPGTNVALMNGLLHEVIGNGWVDREYVDAHTVGFAELEKQVQDYPPEQVAPICRVDAEQIRAAARVLGQARRLLSTVLQGFYQSHQASARRRAGEQPQRHPRHARQARLRDSADERAAERAEHPRVRRRWGHGRVPELEQRCARGGPCAALEPRPAADPAHEPADACPADVPVRRGGIDPVSVGDGHEPCGVAAGAVPGPVDPVAGAAVLGRAGRVLLRDRAAR